MEVHILFFHTIVCRMTNRRAEICTICYYWMGDRWQVMIHFDQVAQHVPFSLRLWALQRIRLEYGNFPSPKYTGFL